MIKCLGIVNFEGSKVRVEGLGKYRTIPAMSFLGRYRVVDFVLSNMVNSGMDNVKILVDDKPRSLMEHIGNGAQYNINSKRGKLEILYTDHNTANKLYITDVSLLTQYRSEVEESDSKYVILAPSNMVCRIDYQEVLNAHIASGADVTAVYKTIDNATERFVGCDEYEFVGNRVANMKVSHGSINVKHISMETFVCSKEKFLELVDNAYNQSPIYTLSEYIGANLDAINVVGFEYKGYLGCINSLNEYYEINMELLGYDNAAALFVNDWPVYTKTNDSPSTLYTVDASVKDCLVANGCNIQGTVESCIVGRGVKVEKGAVVKNSILLPNSVIGADAHVEYAVIDKNAKVLTVKEVVGDRKHILYVKRRDTI